MEETISAADIEDIRYLRYLSTMLFIGSLIILLGTRYKLSKYFKLRKEGIEVDAIITKISGMYVEYEFKLSAGRKISGKIGLKSPLIKKLEEEKTIKCLYDKDNPDNHSTELFIKDMMIIRFFLYILPVIGMVVSAVGLAFTISLLALFQ